MALYDPIARIYDPWSASVVEDVAFYVDEARRSGGPVVELAVGTGLGARLNFDFFLVRFDLGLQTKDPSLPAGQRWIFQPKDELYITRFDQKLNFNLGIGYPF